MARQLVTLAPRQAEIPASLRSVVADSHNYTNLLHSMQRLRGRVYREIGAVESCQLTIDGRHEMPRDEQAWHVLVLNAGQEVIGCARYLRHRTSTSFSRLGVAHSALARCEQWGDKLRSAVNRQIDLAARQGIAFGEVGGWAIAAEHRGSTAAFKVGLAVCAMVQYMGQSVGLTTANMSFGSAAILKRFGMKPIVHNDEELPTYYDPQYKRNIQILQFDSRFPNSRYADALSEMRDYLRTAPVFRASTFTERIAALGQGHLPVPQSAGFELVA
ncbi:MAG TPA: hypothetical protein VE621_12930 [Bryobacteraceae bacterium]|nr:hypothetical protein [Bryobacteraceae bacterium]